MAPSPTPLSEPSDRLDEAVTAYLEALENGSAPDRAVWLAHYADVAPELAEFFADQDQLDMLAAPLREAGQGRPCDTPAPANDWRRDTASEAGSATAGELLPRRLGDYELLEVIGRGGMSVVYKARQLSLNRLLAVKMIRARDPGAAVDLQRLLHEAETIAHLDHPHLVPVYEVGWDQGMPYFSMKLMEGGSLAEALPPLAVQPRAAARLMVQVARAVHHAHQRGILHRDLKPSNILLDQHGQPHVTDFGLAKRLATDSSLTQPGAIVGTPSYMAPEQARGRQGAITTATDLYGLGAVLYTLLTGQPPFRGETVLDTLEQVKEREPERPGGKNRRVDRDLETICLKCLRKEPRERYGSAEALAEDLERWLAGLPVLARRARLGERLAKWARRRPAFAAMVGFTSLMVVALLAGAVWHNVRLNAALHEREREGRRAEANFQRTLQAIDRLLTWVGDGHLAHSPRMEPVRRQVLEDALGFYQQFLQDQDPAPGVRREVGRAHWRVGRIYFMLRRPAEASAAYRRGAALLEELAADFPAAPEYRADLAHILTDLGTVLKEAGQLPEAEEVYERAIALQTKLVEDATGTAEYRSTQALILRDLGVLRRESGRFPKADQTYRQALAVFEELVRDFPTEPKYRGYLASTRNNRANLLHTLGQADRAEQEYQSAVKIQEELVREFDAVPEYRQGLARSYNNLGTLWCKSNPEQAEQAYQQAVTIQRRLAADFPSVPEYESDLARTLDNQANLLKNTNQPDQAKAAYAEALAIYQKQAAEFPTLPECQSGLGATLNDWAGLLRRTGGRKDLLEAKGLLEKAIRHQQAALRYKPQHPQYVQFLCKHYGVLADTLVQLRDHGAAATAAAELANLTARIDDVPGAQWQVYFRAASLLARCVPLAENDPLLSEAQQRATTQRYAEQAMNWLRQAIAKGYKDAKRLQEVPDLASLRQRPDFENLLSALRDGANPN
jgi:tetratricopeptide (TPR) repeat protein/tRNA A-37 threonylcarbamoyl transferase component Bud32